jgi:hypothetical protein
MLSQANRRQDGDPPANNKQDYTIPADLKFNLKCRDPAFRYETTIISNGDNDSVHFPSGNMSTGHQKRNARRPSGQHR